MEDDLKKYTVYVLECSDGTYYTGYTSDVTKRLAAHRCGKGAKYTRGREPLSLIYEEHFDSKSDALKREYAIKQLTKSQKETLIESRVAYEYSGKLQE